MGGGCRGDGSGYTHTDANATVCCTLNLLTMHVEAATRKRWPPDS